MAIKVTENSQIVDRFLARTSTILREVKVAPISEREWEQDFSVVTASIPLFKAIITVQPLQRSGPLWNCTVSSWLAHVLIRSWDFLRWRLFQTVRERMKYATDCLARGLLVTPPAIETVKLPQQDLGLTYILQGLHVMSRPSRLNIPLASTYQCRASSRPTHPC